MLHNLEHLKNVDDTIWIYIVPLSIPLLLFSVDIKNIFYSTHRLLILFLISSLGTFLGTLIAYYLLSHFRPGLDKIAAALAASYTGGTVNLITMADKVNLPKENLSTVLITDNFMMACLFIVLIILVTSKAVISFWGSIHSQKNFNQNNNQNNPKNKNVSLMDIAFSLSAAFLIVAISFTLSDFLKATLIPLISPNSLKLLISFFSDKYLVLTTLTLFLITIFPNFFKQLRASFYLGTLGIFIFFAAIGAPTSINQIITQAPLLFLFVLIIVSSNLLFTLFWGRVFHYPIEEIALACNANIGGPSTAAALATSQKWNQLISPILIIGSFGYALGNYIGSIVYLIIQSYQ